MKLDVEGWCILVYDVESKSREPSLSFFQKSKLGLATPWSYCARKPEMCARLLMYGNWLAVLQAISRKTADRDVQRLPAPISEIRDGPCDGG